jgi:hypothetical protein
VTLLATASFAANVQTSTRLLLINGKVWTGNPKQPEAEALASSGTHPIS